MQQYFAKNKNLDLEDGDYHHIKNVMKMKRGDLIKVVYDNVIYTCKLNNVSNKSTFDIINKEAHSKNMTGYEYLQSLIKNYNYTLDENGKYLSNNNPVAFTDQVHYIKGPGGDIYINKSLYNAKTTFNNESEIIKYLEFCNEIGVNDVGFVSLMEANNYCKSHFKDFNDFNFSGYKFDDKVTYCISFLYKNFLKSSSLYISLCLNLFINILFISFLLIILSILL